MYAIVSIAGQQFKVEEGQKVFVHRLDAKKGDKVSFEDVHMIVDGDKAVIGTPLLDGAGVNATVIEELVKGDKEIVFKKKRRKGYRKKNGHRQQFTLVEINSLIAGSGASKKKEAKVVATAVAVEKPKTKKAEPEAVAETVKAPKTAKGDNLVIIEGIGPKVKQLLNDHGIFTFVELAQASVESVKAILDAQGGVYHAMDPGTWGQQAQLAAEGKMDELKALQDDLKGGRVEE